MCVLMLSTNKIVAVFSLLLKDSLNQDPVVMNESFSTTKGVAFFVFTDKCENSSWEKSLTGMCLRQSCLLSLSISPSAGKHGVITGSHSSHVKFHIDVKRCFRSKPKQVSTCRAYLFSFSESDVSAKVSQSIFLCMCECVCLFPLGSFLSHDF